MSAFMTELIVLGAALFIFAFITVIVWPRRYVPTEKDYDQYKKWLK